MKHMSVQITLSLTDKFYQRLQALAVHQERDVSDLLAAYLEQNLLPTDMPSLPKDGDREREKEAFRLLFPRLQQEYAGQYVAIYQGELVDHDIDKVALFARLNEQYPQAFVLVRPVQETAEIEYRWRSPRFVATQMPEEG